MKRMGKLTKWATTREQASGGSASAIPSSYTSVLLQNYSKWYALTNSSSTGIPEHARCEGHQVIVLYDPRNDQAVALHLGLGFKSIQFHKEWISYLNGEI